LPKALIIDDSPFARRVIRHHLTKFGFKVVGEAESAAQAILMFDELRPDLVTMDVMMPEVGGIDSLLCFRAMREDFPDVAIVIVSSVPFDKIRDTFLKEGAVAYVVKPFNQLSFESLRQKLTRHFSTNRRQPAELANQ
jgi:two-component system chemotaxis response regulator CheY